MHLNDPLTIVVGVALLLIVARAIRWLVHKILRIAATLIGLAIIVWLLATLTGHPLSWPA